jgi:dihydrofolate synthase/folylpolyglutamate synthase
LHPRAIDLSLERLRVVLDRLHWRQPALPVITVAGTNGKGSVTAYCSSILRAAGYRVGAFTSPHLRNYSERIRVHDRNVGEAQLVSAFEKIESVRGEVGLTYFEFNALAAFLVFEHAQLDVWVLEIGMGGRLDAVNIVDPDVAVVVSIGLDHQEYLGETLDAIALEKAGIFRKGRAAVLGGRAPLPVLETRAHAVGAVLKRMSIEYNYILEGEGWRYRGTRWELPWLPAPALQGDIQFSNAATALAALEELPRHIEIPAAAVAQGLATTRLGGRFQRLAAHGNGPAWILDVAHNADAAAVLARNLRDTANGGRTAAVCGILADKNVAAIVEPLRDCIDAWWCASIEGSRGQSGTRLAEQVRALVDSPVAESSSVARACEAAAAEMQRGDRVVVFGSFHTVGPALDWLEARGIALAEER